MIGDTAENKPGVAPEVNAPGQATSDVASAPEDAHSSLRAAYTRTTHEQRPPPTAATVLTLTRSTRNLDAPYASEPCTCCMSAASNTHGAFDALRDPVHTTRPPPGDDSSSFFKRMTCRGVRGHSSHRNTHQAYAIHPHVQVRDGRGRVSQTAAQSQPVYEGRPGWR